MESSSAFLYIDFAIIIGVSVLTLFLRWKATLSLAPLLFPAYASCAIAIILNDIAKTTYQQVLQLFFSFLAIVYAILLVIQCAVNLAYEGSIPYDPTLVSEISFHDEEWLLISILIAGLIVALVEIVRVVLHCRQQTRSGKQGKPVCACCGSPSKENRARGK
jgi:hypothetical protein